MHKNDLVPRCMQYIQYIHAHVYSTVRTKHKGKYRQKDHLSNVNQILIGFKKKDTQKKTLAFLAKMSNW